MACLSYTACSILSDYIRLQESPRLVVRRSLKVPTDKLMKKLLAIFFRRAEQRAVNWFNAADPAALTRKLEKICDTELLNSNAVEAETFASLREDGQTCHTTLLVSNDVEAETSASLKGSEKIRDATSLIFKYVETETSALLKEFEKICDTELLISNDTEAEELYLMKANARNKMVLLFHVTEDNRARYSFTPRLMEELKLAENVQARLHEKECFGHLDADDCPRKLTLLKDGILESYGDEASYMYPNWIVPEGKGAVVLGDSYSAPNGEGIVQPPHLRATTQDLDLDTMERIFSTI